MTKNVLKIVVGLVLTYGIGMANVVALSQEVSPPPAGVPGNAAGGEEEKNPPTIDAIHITGASKFSEKYLLSNISMRTHGKISRILVKNSCNEIAAIYQKKGSDAAVTPNITHPADGHVVVELKVDESGKGGFSWHP